MSLGLIIRALRDKNAWSQEYVANELNMSQPAYCNLELDKTKLSFERAKKLATLYDVPISMFSKENNSTINYNTGQFSRTIINSKITEEKVSLEERQLFQNIITDNDVLIRLLMDEINDLRSDKQFLKDQLALKLK
ncbi:helix-turn-helix domain-containing protein [Sphingobacterium sp. ML3W]|uniref:helix-turn-helix domain-containing protein n=1 Tax=Sphingobacterium sp. ML3W TaxID=1538644 RepID=UPI0005711E8D|nr:helix-turn-helix domain-containing protein [Sphingobacterium sp. ML3W]